jgi:ribosomal protein S12 methylthiotransferase accessory factor YcaO
MSPGSRTLPHGDAEALIRWCRAADDDLRALARAAARLDALFVIDDTADCVVIGAVFAAAGARFSATGAGAGRRAALGACMGEAVETIAQAPEPDDMVARAARCAPPADAAPGFAGRLTTDAPVGWVRAERIADGASGLVPAPLVLRGLAGGDGAPLSLGCAAGPTRAAARRAGALELVERAALAAWRAGGAVARALRRRPDDAAPWMARIEPDGWLPVVAARSASGEGVAAGETEAEAAAGALRELRAAEAAARFAGARAASPLPPGPLPPAGDAAVSLAATLSDPAWAGRALWAVDLTRPAFAVPVVKVLASDPHPG